MIFNAETPDKSLFLSFYKPNYQNNIMHFAIFRIIMVILSIIYIVIYCPANQESFKYFNPIIHTAMSMNL